MFKVLAQVGSFYAYFVSTLEVTPFVLKYEFPSIRLKVYQRTLHNLVVDSAAAEAIHLKFCQLFVSKYVVSYLAKTFIVLFIQLDYAEEIISFNFQKNCKVCTFY